jgi:type IV secretion system protein VirB1
MIELNALILQCALNVAPTTMMAIIKTESRSNPLAIGINKGYKLKYQPKDENQAKAWVTYLENNNYNFDVGLAQINIKNIHKYGYKAADAIDPCLNLKMASDILHKNYRGALATSSNSKDALQKAISAYNTGNYQAGFRNGYVQRVYANANIKIDNNLKIPPIINPSSTKISKSSTVSTKTINKGSDVPREHKSRSTMVYARKNPVSDFY